MIALRRMADLWGEPLGETIGTQSIEISEKLALRCYNAWLHMSIVARTKQDIESGTNRSFPTERGWRLRICLVGRSRYRQHDSISSSLRSMYSISYGCIYRDRSEHCRLRSIHAGMMVQRGGGQDGQQIDAARPAGGDRGGACSHAQQQPHFGRQDLLQGRQVWLWRCCARALSTHLSRALAGISCIFFDEFHERSVESDLSFAPLGLSHVRVSS